MNGEDALCYFSSSFVAMPTLKGGAPYWKTGHGTGRKDVGPELEETTFSEDGMDGYPGTPLE